MIDTFLQGSIAACLLICGLMFLRFWRDSKDELFVYFAAAFFIMTLNRIAVSMLGARTEVHGSIYVIRMAAFLLIAIAIWRKNTAKDKH
jgi:hypothetical protein